MEETPPHHPPAAESWTHRHLPLALALAAGVGLSAALFSLVREKERERLQAEFERRAAIPAAELQREIDDHLYPLRSIGYFFFSSVEVDRGEFRNFTREDLARLPGLRAFEWAPRVLEAGRASLEQSAGAEARKYRITDQLTALEQFQIREWNSQGAVQPATPRAEYFPIYFMEPGGGSLGVLGLDLASHPAYRATMAAALDQGTPCAAAPFPLGHEGGGLFGCRVFMPIYTNGAAHGTSPERSEHLAGYATTVIHVRNLVEASLQRLDRLKGFAVRDVAIRLTDEQGDPRQPLYQSPDWIADGATNGAAVETTMPLFLADRRWQLRTRPTAGFIASHRPWGAWLALDFGLMFTALLGVYLFGVSGREARIGRLVHQRTAELAESNDELKNEIARRKRDQEATAQQRRLVDMLMDGIPDHIYFKDRESRFIRINRAMAAMFGLRDDQQAAGKTDFDFFTPEHAQRAFADEQEILRTGAPLIGREEKETWPDGTVTWVSTTKQALRNERGEIVGTFGMSRDITARKLAEEALAQKAEELARSNTELEQFAYVASHDLQEPLRMIASYTQLLERRYKDRLDADATDYINFAVDGARRMQVLINDLLAYSRVGRRGRPFALTDCAEVLQATLANLKIALEESGAVVTHTPLPRLVADGPQLTQLFQNLIGNAIKFRGAAPPKIHVSAELPPAGETPAGQPGVAEWLFTVRDNGIGIEPQYFARIFVIFQRLHTREEYPGTGIGLAVCKKIVERHGGRIWVESKPGQGTAFHFTLPGAAPTADGGPSAPSG